MSMEQHEEVNATARHAQLVEETTRLQQRDKARDRLLLAMADALGIAVQHSYNLVGHDPRYEGVQKELKEAKIIFAATLDKL